jgi:predicted 3-demethylubiquinone-9 3-methyltransferase (glyoxalase superfamily)
MPPIVTSLWFDSQALEAAQYYVSIFPRSEVRDIAYYGAGAPMPAGSVLTVDFALDGHRFVALNGGPAFSFSEAISLLIECADQAEVDEYWERLTEGGEESQCGWLKDRFGLSWQVVPRDLYALLSDPDPARAQRATAAMLSQRRIILADIIAAADAG